MKRKILLAGVLSAVVLVTGCMGNRPENAEKEIINEVVKRPVEVMSLSQSSIKEEFYSLGAVEAGRTYTLNAQVNADVEKVYVNVGDTVKAGDLLFELETNDFQTNKTSQLSGVKAQLDSSKIQRDAAEKNFNDTKILYDQGASSKSALDSATDNYNSAKINYNNTLTSYNTTLSSLSSSEEKYLVVSPVDGIVTSRTLEEGQFATTQNGIVVSEYDPVKVKINIPSARIDEAYVGQPVHIEFPTQNSSLEGTLSALNLSGKAGGYPAEINLENTEGKLLPGMVAEVYLQTMIEENAFVVDKNMVITDESGSYVFVIVDEMAVRIDVQTGLENGSTIQVIGELNTGDQIVYKGQQYLSDEEAVMVK